VNDAGDEVLACARLACDETVESVCATSSTCWSTRLSAALVPTIPVRTGLGELLAQVVALELDFGERPAVADCDGA
jgi:hypothetical protein